MSHIRDKDVNNALQTLIDEFENKEEEVRDLEKYAEEMSDKVDTLETKVLSLKDKIVELEEALAEAYLTSETEGINNPCNESSQSQISTED